MQKAAIYARFSSHNQREVSIDDQVAECGEAAARDGYEVCAVYADRAVSGTTDRRPEFLRMVGDARSAEWSRVYVWKVDRFGRDRYDIVVYKRRLRKLGVEVVSACEPVPDGPSGVLLESVLEGAAEYYSRNLSENVMRGLHSRARGGHPCGERRYGWSIAGARIDGEGRYVAGDHYEVCEEEAAWVREMYAMRAGGASFPAIAEALSAKGCTNTLGGPISKHVVARIVRDDAYKGVYRLGETVVPGGIPAIVGEAEWEAAQGVSRGVGKRPRSYAARKGDLSGMQFGDLLVICYHETRKGNRKWLCRCSCGKMTVEWGTRLTSGKATHCGCRGDGRPRDDKGRFAPMWPEPQAPARRYSPATSARTAESSASRPPSPSSA